jgi:hypothetical protein
VGILTDDGRGEAAGNEEAQWNSESSEGMAVPRLREVKGRGMGLNEESSAPPTLRAGQREKERIIVPEEEKQERED